MKLTRLIVPCVLATALLQGCASSSSTKETSTEDNKTTSNAATTSTKDTNASLKNNNVANPTAFLTETVAAAKKASFQMCHLQLVKQRIHKWKNNGENQTYLF